MPLNGTQNPKYHSKYHSDAIQIPSTIQWYLNGIFCKGSLKANTSNLAPILTNIINQSYEYPLFRQARNILLITPLLKRSRLSADDYASYRPISNLPYASILLEHHVSAQLRLHLQGNDFENSFQSVYRPADSVESAIICIQNDVLRYQGIHKHVVLVLPDLSATFDTINHDIL